MAVPKWWAFRPSPRPPTRLRAGGRMPRPGHPGHPGRAARYVPSGGGAGACGAGGARRGRSGHERAAGPLAGRVCGGDRTLGMRRCRISPGRTHAEPFATTRWRPGSPTWMPFPCRILPCRRNGRLCHRWQKTVMVQTSRGCPFDCSFCSVTGMFGRKFRYRSVESIIEELRRYDRRTISFFSATTTSPPTSAGPGPCSRRCSAPGSDSNGPHRCGPIWRAILSWCGDETGGLPHGVHRVRIGQSPEPGGNEEEPESGGHRATPSG